VLILSHITVRHSFAETNHLKVQHSSESEPRLDWVPHTEQRRILYHQWNWCISLHTVHIN